MDPFIIYSIVISGISIILTLYDKHQAIRRKQRVAESTLMMIAFLGGAFGMFVTMRIIRHKTLHKKFMIGLPLISMLHAIFLYCIIRNFY